MQVSIIVPCRNEVRHVRVFLDSVLAQELPTELQVEMLVADGYSSDGTKQILEEYAAAHSWIRIVDNPELVVSTGLNRAIGLATGEIILRMDVHAHYARDYVAQCVAVLLESRADNVGGPARTRFTGNMQRAISAAYNSPFACGGSRFHDVNYEGDVDTVTFGCWHKSIFAKIGLFDEDLVRNQDDELNFRITRSGGRIFQSPRIRCWYEPRATLYALATQYLQYGFWKVHVIRKHGSPASFRHLIPATFVISIVLTLVAALFSKVGMHALVFILGAYSLANLAASAIICRQSDRLFPAMPVVLATYHLSYGIGFLAGMISALASLTRGQSHTFRHSQT
jgi:succinoglycan biosynthesis protein ExoA